MTDLIDISGILEQKEFAWGIVSETGMVLRDEISESDWSRIMGELCRIFETSGKTNAQASMMIGDGLIFGERFGESFADVIDSTREYMRAVGIKTLQNWAWIAKKIEPSRRHQNLSLGHHEAAARLQPEDQVKFLTLAENEAMTVKELRTAIREAKPSKRKKKEPVVKLDNAESALQKLIDVSNWLSEHSDEITAKWKEPLAKCQKVYRRKWQTGHKK